MNMKLKWVLLAREMLRWSLQFSASGFTLNATSPPQIFILFSPICITHTHTHLVISPLALFVYGWFSKNDLSQWGSVHLKFVNLPAFTILRSVFICSPSLIFLYKKTHLNPFCHFGRYSRWWHSLPLADLPKGNVWITLRFLSCWIYMCNCTRETTCIVSHLPLHSLLSDDSPMCKHFHSADI